MAKMYAVALDSPDATVGERLRTKYDKVFAYTDAFYLVVGGVNDVTDDVAVAAGIKSDRRQASGVVFRLNGSYSGYAKRALWEWLHDMEGG